MYRPPGQLGDFLEELDVLLSNFPEDGTPLVLLGDFNIHLDKPQATDFNTLLTSFDLNECLLRLLTNQVTNWTSSTHATAPLTTH